MNIYKYKKVEIHSLGCNLIKDGRTFYKDADISSDYIGSIQVEYR